MFFGLRGLSASDTSHTNETSQLAKLDKMNILAFTFIKQCCIKFQAATDVVARQLFKLTFGLSGLLVIR